MAGKKQLKIPGTQPKEIKEVNAAAESYVDVRDERMALTERETEARDALVKVMKKHGLDVYVDEDAAPPLVVTIIAGEDKVKVRRAEDSESLED